jgi:hypothetical protein
METGNTSTSHGTNYNSWKRKAMGKDIASIFHGTNTG